MNETRKYDEQCSVWEAAGRRCTRPALHAGSHSSDERYNPIHPQHRELMLSCCAHGDHELGPQGNPQAAREDRWANGTYTTVGLYVKIEAWGVRMVRIVREGRTRITVAVVLKNGRRYTRTVTMRDIAVPASTADILTKQLTAFGSLREMADAAGNYRPTILPRSIGHRLLAAAYDSFQKSRGDARRAYTGEVL